MTARRYRHSSEGRRRELALRTVSVRLSEADVARLIELKTALGKAETHSPVWEEIQQHRGRHTAYGSPIADGEAIRWALAFALERFPADGMTAPAPYDDRDRDRRTVDR
jgi:hypothetical protein